MNASQILSQIDKVQLEINHALEFMKKNENFAFYKNLIQIKSIELYTLITQLKNDGIENKNADQKEKIIEGHKIEPKIVHEIRHEDNKREEAAVKPMVVQKEKIKIDNSNLQSNDMEELSLNEKISKHKEGVLNYAEKSKETPISDMSKAISISKKFEFINGLFDGNADAYKNCLQKLESTNTYIEASQYLEDSIVSSFNWDENETLASEFFALLRRRFN